MFIAIFRFTGLILSLISAAFIMGGLAGLVRGIQVVWRNQYVASRMWRIALLEVFQEWSAFTMLGLQAALVVLICAFALTVTWKLLFRNTAHIKDEMRLRALTIAAIWFVFMIFFSSRILQLRTASIENLWWFLTIFCSAIAVAWLCLRVRSVSIALSHSRLWRFGAAFGLLVLLFNLAAYADRNGNAPSRPNVVWIVIDSLRADHLGSYGYSRPTSPYLDRFAAQSIKFEQAFSQESFTQASVPSYFTSTYPWVHRVLYTHPKINTLHDRFITIAEILRNENFSTAAVAFNPFMNGLGQGFETFHYRTKQTYDSYQSAEKLFQRTRGYLMKRSAKRPLFLYLHYMDVHMPYLPPDPYTKMYLPEESDSRVRRLMKRTLDFQEDEAKDFMSLYDAEINFTDDAVSKMLALLSRHKIDVKNTIFIFTADHGEDFYDPHPDNPGGIGHHRTLYREVTHVPLIISAPGLQAKTIGSRVELIDLVPTVLDLLHMDAKKYPQFQGRSLLPLMQGKQHSDEIILSGGARGRHSVISGNWKYYRYEWKCQQSMFYCRGNPVHTARLKWGEQLFDVMTDPLETKNLLSEQPDVASAMRKLSTEILKGTPQEDSSSGVAMDEQTREQLRSLGYIEN